MRYQTVFQPGEDEFVEKKSRFIGMAWPVESEEEAGMILEEIRRQYWNATHNNVYAFCIGTEARIKRFSDDGEPVHTAGMPLLDLLEGEKLTNVLIVVVRYFGGTLLGTGGLVRAYTKAGRLALQSAVIVTKVTCRRCVITMPYTLLGRLQYGLMQDGYQIEDITYAEQVVLKLLVEEERYEAFEKKITALSEGRLSPKDEACVLATSIDGRLRE